MTNRRIGETVSAKVVKILESGAIVSFDGGTGFLHVSELSDKFVKIVTDVIELNQEISVVITERKGEKTFVSLKAVKTDEQKRQDFEEKVQNYLKDSSENMRQIQKSNDRKRKIVKKTKKIK